MAQVQKKYILIIDDDTEFFFKRRTIDEDTEIAKITSKIYPKDGQLVGEFTNEELKTVLPMILSPEMTEDQKKKIDAEMAVEVLADFLARGFALKNKVTQSLMTSAAEPQQP